MARSISSLVADNIRTSASSSLRLPTGQYTLSCNTLSSSVCISGGMFPISSRKSVPPLAVSKYPAVSFFASVNAPCTWPKNSDAASSPRIQPQFTATKGLSLRPLCCWISCATDSFPLPFGPRIMTEQFKGATRQAIRSVSRTAPLSLFINDFFGGTETGRPINPRNSSISNSSWTGLGK